MYFPTQFIHLGFDVSVFIVVQPLVKWIAAHLIHRVVFEIPLSVSELLSSMALCHARFSRIMFPFDSFIIEIINFPGIVCVIVVTE